VPLTPQAVDLRGPPCKSSPSLAISYSKALPTIHRRREVEPWVARDMEEQQSADVEALIGEFLSNTSILPNDRDTNIAVFNECRGTAASLWSETQDAQSPIATTIITSLKE
jgi:hypothetical protein